MPRQARLDLPGALHHIMVRGINRMAIFSEEQDKEQFLERLGGNIAEGQCSVYAWVIMNNHVHLLFKSGKQGISDIMRKLLTWYARYYNRRHRRTGHLFENRYKSILCEEDTYLLALVRYIHLNPVKTDIVRTLEELDGYPWSGHSAIMGKVNQCRGWIPIMFLLSLELRGVPPEIHIEDSLKEGIALGRRSEFTGGGLTQSEGGWSQVIAMKRRGQKEESDERILGSGDFVDTVLKEAEDRYIRQLKVRQKGVTIETIIDEECTIAGISEKEVKAGSRRGTVSRLRTKVAYRSRKELGLSAAEIARHTGVSTSGITPSY